MRKRNLNLRIISYNQDKPIKEQESFCAITTKGGRVIGRLDCKEIQIEINHSQGMKVLIKLDDIIVQNRESRDDIYRRIGVDLADKEEPKLSQGGQSYQQM